MSRLIERFGLSSGFGSSSKRSGFVEFRKLRAFERQVVHQAFGAEDETGFTLNAAVACRAHQRGRLERICRYITRPALCLEWLSVDATGQVVYELKHPFHDGTTHVLFSAQDFIARLAALVPRPRFNLTRYHGVFAPGSPFRRAIVPARHEPA